MKALPNCDIFKTAKYNNHQHFSFYRTCDIIMIYIIISIMKHPRVISNMTRVYYQSLRKHQEREEFSMLHSLDSR